MSPSLYTFRELDAWIALGWGGRGRVLLCFLFFFPQFALVPILAPGCVVRESESETKELQSCQLNWPLLFVILEKQ